MKRTYILGISCFYHDSAATLIRDGEIISAVQEERFSRIKHDPQFPYESIKFLLNEEDITLEQIEAIVYYEKPFITFERIIETHLNYAPWGIKSFLSSIPIWLREKLFLKQTLLKHLKRFSQTLPPIKFSEHHLSHASSAFFPSPFEKAAIICIDGVGEWATTSGWVGYKNNIKPLWEIHFPHSLGLFYSAITSYLGFKVNSGEYKVMGLAPYGVPRFSELFLKELVHLHQDGSYSLNMIYFEYGHKLKMFGSKLEELLGSKARVSETTLNQFHMDVAASLQVAFEECLLHVVTHFQKSTNEENLCIAGGVALNCVANSKLLQKSGFKNIWIQPSAGDAGGSLGAALAYWHLDLKEPRIVNSNDSQKGSQLGPVFSNDKIKLYLEQNQLPHTFHNDDDLMTEISRHLEEGKVIGLFQGKMEFGPRALGNRSIMADARILDLQKTMNLKIKFRESFRPFAPIVLDEDASEIFNFEGESPYMLFVANVSEKYRTNTAHREEFGIDKLNMVRSIYPAITHVDHSARLQTVDKLRHPRLWKLLKEFKMRNERGILVNTSFNVRGEPIVCTPQDAYRCFRRTDIDILVLENFLLTKENLPDFTDTDWKKEYELD